MFFYLWLVMLFACPVMMPLLSRHTRWGRIRRHPGDARANVWRTVILSNVLWFGYPVLLMGLVLGSSILPALATLPLAALAWWALGALPESGNAELERAARYWFGGLLAMLTLATLVQLASIPFVVAGLTSSLAPVGLLVMVNILLPQAGAWVFSTPVLRSRSPESPVPVRVREPVDQSARTDVAEVRTSARRIFVPAGPGGSSWVS